MTREDYLSEVAAGIAEARAGLRRAYDAARMEHLERGNSLEIGIMDDLIAVRGAIDATLGKIARHEPDWAASLTEGNARNRVAIWERIKPAYKKLRDDHA